MTPERSLVFSWLTPTAGLHPDDATDIAALHRELSPTATPVTMYDIWVTGEHNPIIIGRDPETNRIIAMATLVPMRLLRGSRGYIHDVVIASSHRGKGHGKPLLEKLVERARKLRLTSLELPSSDDRAAALNLYDSLGFKLRETNVLTLSLTA